jgi:hypothetical protein
MAGYFLVLFHLVIHPSTSQEMAFNEWVLSSNPDCRYHFCTGIPSTDVGIPLLYSLKVVGSVEQRAHGGAARSKRVYIE